MRHLVNAISDTSAICGAGVPGQNTDYATTTRELVQCPSCLREIRFQCGDYDAEEVSEYMARANGPISPAIATISGILNDPCASRWVRNAIQEAIKRDIVDAANDAELVAKVLRQRCNEYLGTTSVKEGLRTELFAAAEKLMDSTEAGDEGLLVCDAEALAVLIGVIQKMRKA